MNKIKKIINQMFNVLGYSINKVKKTQKLPNFSENDLYEYKILAELPGCLGPDAFALFKNLSKLDDLKIDTILEIGVFCGRSLLGLACAFKKAEVTGVDPFFNDFHNSPAFYDEAEYLKSKAGLATREQRIEKIWLVADKFKSFRGRIKLEAVTQESFLAKNNKKFNLIHVDGEHSFKAVDDVLDALDNILQPNALIVIDDLPSPGFPEIAEAVYTHKKFKQKFFPLVYGCNKGVFIYQPDNTTKLKNIKQQLLEILKKTSTIRIQTHDESILIIG